MPRNKSEKRAPLDQAVYDYIKGWVEHSCDDAGGSKRGVLATDFGAGPGHRMWMDLGDAGRGKCLGIPCDQRWEWLRAQK